MEKEIVWTANAENDLRTIVAYLSENWSEDVLAKFRRTLILKAKLIQRYPNIGHKSTKYSRYRKTLITKQYLLIYSISYKHIVIHRIRHTKQNS